MPPKYGRTSTETRRRSGASALAAAAGVVLGVVLVASNAYVAWSQCSPPGPEAINGHQVCTTPPPPSPSTFLAAGTIFSVTTGQFESFQFQPSDASLAVLNGSFTASAGVVILVMTPGEYSNFSRAPTVFPCAENGECYATGNLSVGGVHFTLLLYANTDGGTGVAPWYLVMQNVNTVSPTAVAWTTGLVATYVDVYA